MISSGIENPPIILQQAKFNAQKSACFTPKAEPRSLEQKPFVFKNNIKKNVFLSPPKLGAIIRNKESKEYAKWKDPRKNM